MSEPGWKNLADIVGMGGHPGTDDRRVVAFAVDGDTLKAREECDDYYSTRLNVEEVGRLIAWLTAARKQMEEPT